MPGDRTQRAVCTQPPQRTRLSFGTFSLKFTKRLWRRSSGAQAIECRDPARQWVWSRVSEPAEELPPVGAHRPTLCGITWWQVSRPKMETLSSESPIRLVQVTNAQVTPPHPTGGYMTCLWACLVYHQGDPPATSASLAPQSLDSSCPCCPQDTMLPPTSGLLHMLFPLLICPFPHPTSLSK